MKTISGRMIDRSSNTSRLVEKLRTKKLIDRKINEEDRRKVDIFITDKGLELIQKASVSMRKFMNEEFKHISEEEAGKLNELLDKFRG